MELALLRMDTMLPDGIPIHTTSVHISELIPSTSGK